MSVKPILFNTDMVRVILYGRKTVTRRVMKPQIPDHCPNCMVMHKEFIYDTNAENVYCARCGWPLYNGGFPYKGPYQPGDILYVRETWNHYIYDDLLNGTHKEGYFYKASPEMKSELPDYVQCHFGEIWRPSIHMPKEAARIWLKVTNVRVERLQEITIDGIRNEGLTSMAVHAGDMEIALSEWKNLWNSTIKTDLDRYGWDANPFVWVIEFERYEKPE